MHCIMAFEKIPVKKLLIEWFLIKSLILL
jgi:hypothetical protein